MDLFVEECPTEEKATTQEAVNPRVTGERAAPRAGVRSSSSSHLLAKSHGPDPVCESPLP